MVSNRMDRSVRWTGARPGTTTRRTTALRCATRRRSVLGMRPSVLRWRRAAQMHRPALMQRAVLRPGSPLLAKAILGSGRTTSAPVSSRYSRARRPVLRRRRRRCTASTLVAQAASSTPPIVSATSCTQGVPSRSGTADLTLNRGVQAISTTAIVSSVSAVAPSPRAQEAAACRSLAEGRRPLVQFRLWRHRQERKKETSMKIAADCLSSTVGCKRHIVKPERKNRPSTPISSERASFSFGCGVAAKSADE